LALIPDVCGRNFIIFLSPFNIRVCRYSYSSSIFISFNMLPDVILTTNIFKHQILVIIRRVHSIPGRRRN